jgi:hypothetical protein
LRVKGIQKFAFFWYLNSFLTDPNLKNTGIPFLEHFSDPSTCMNLLDAGYKGGILHQSAC